jgi:hypothetical protein
MESCIRVEAGKAKKDILRLRGVLNAHQCRPDLCVQFTSDSMSNYNMQIDIFVFHCIEDPNVFYRLQCFQFQPYKIVTWFIDINQFFYSI